MNHLVIYSKKMFAKDYIGLILTGSKSIGSKFTTTRIAPYQKLQDGDYLYLKESSGPVLGRVRVSHVSNEEILDPEEIMNFLVRHSKEIGIDTEEQLMSIWRQNAHKRYLCHWIMEEPMVTRHPVFIQKRDRRIWVAGFEPNEELRAACL